MSYETDNLKREIERVKWGVHRKVESEDHRRDIHNIEERITRMESNLRNEIDGLARRFDEFLQERDN